MTLGSCLVRRQSVLVGLAVSVFIASGTTSAGPECATVGGVNRVDVSSDSDVQDLRELLENCSGGVFDVYWHGRVEVSDTIYVSNGTDLTITGVYDSSSSSAQEGSGDDDNAYDPTAGAAVIDGGYRTSDGLFGVYNGSTLSLESLVLEKGTSSTYGFGGGAVQAGNDTLESVNTVNVNDCTFQDNEIFSSSYLISDDYSGWNVIDYGYGGAISCQGCVLDIDGNTTFANNRAYYGSGGAIYAESAKVNISGSTTFFNNSALLGGAIYVHESVLGIDGAITFDGNSAVDSSDDEVITFCSGGAIFSSSSGVDIAGNAIFNNNSVPFSGNGGAISFHDSFVDISGAVFFTGNFASYYGGAIFIDGTTIAIFGATFTSNQATYDGGALWLGYDHDDSTGGLSFEELIFENNSAGSEGGALWLEMYDVFSDCSIRGCSFSNNRAGDFGGAIYLIGTLNLDGGPTDFTGNAAGDDGLAVMNLGEFQPHVDVFFSSNRYFCPEGKYSGDVEGSQQNGSMDSVCRRCDTGLLSNFNGTLHFEQGDLEPICEDSPKGVKGAGTTVATFNLEEGYYRSSAESITIIECYNKDACVGGDTVGEYCASGYEGPLCAVCAEDYAPGVGLSCHKCSGQAETSAVGIGVAVLIVVLLMVALILMELVRVVDDGGRELYTKSEGGRPSSTSNQEGPTNWELRFQYVRKLLTKAIPLTSLKTVVIVWQIVTQFSDIAGNAYPDVYEEFLSKLNFINVDFGFFISSSCVMRTSFYHRLLFATILPLVILLVLAGAYRIAKERNKNSELALIAVKDKHLSAALFVVFFVYSSVSFTIFQTFICDTLDDGKSYLRADYNLTCSGSRHTAYVTFAVVMALVYPIGIPFVAARWLFAHKEDLKKADRDSIPGLAPFSSVWASYKPSRYYYEVVEFGRRLALTGVAVFAYPGSSAQIAIVLLLAAVFLFVSESLSPFESRIDMGLYRWGNAVVLASMYVALLLKTDVSEDSTDAVSTFAGVLIAANVFMVVTVIVQSFFMVQQWRKANESPKDLPHPEPTVFFERTSPPRGRTCLTFQDSPRCTFR